MYKTTPVNVGKKLLRKLRKSAVATQLPHLPVQGPDNRGKQQTTHNITQTYIQMINEEV